MYQAYKAKRMSYRGWTVAVLAHVVLGWLLISGTARNGLKAVKKSLQAEVIQEVIIPPPPPPPPLVKPPEQLKVQAPPPPTYVPPAEVAAPPSAAPVMAATAVVPVAPAPIAPPPPPPAPLPAKAEMSVACPRQVQPEMPRKAVQDGISGTVRAQARIKGGKVLDVTILSANPPRVFNNAVIAAMKQYGCVDHGDHELTAIQEFAFKIED